MPTSLRDHVLDQLHDSKISGWHFAFQKTLDRARQRFWWPKMRREIELKCESCLVCQARSTAGKKRKAPLQTIDVGIRLNMIASDILGPITKTKPTGYKYIFVLTDFFKKYVVSLALQSTTAEAVAKALVEYWILLFGTPDSVHTDHGTNFCSELILELCRLLAIDKTRTLACHPQGNGMVERHNRVIADVISKYRSGNPHTLDKMLPYLSFVYNTTVHRTTGHTPFSLVFGQECRYPIDLFLPKAPGQEIRNYEFTRWLEEQFTEAHMNARETLGCNQERQKDIYQKDVFSDAYKAGDKVWLFAPHKAMSRKFFLSWDGTYTILEKISVLHYKISKNLNIGKKQIAYYNQLKPVKERVDQQRILTRPIPEKLRQINKLIEEDDYDRPHRQIIATSVDHRRGLRRPEPFKWMDEDEDYFYDLFDEGNRRRVQSSMDKGMGEAEEALESNPSDMTNPNPEEQSNSFVSNSSPPAEQQIEAMTSFVPYTFTPQKAPTAEMTESNRPHKLKTVKPNTSNVRLEPLNLDATHSNGGRPKRTKKCPKRYGIDDE